jgi:hypothetical protein|tara:strand:- start:259 stop:507 length:249 start_codon:yes stop_codon:yes gene_type:complete
MSPNDLLASIRPINPAAFGPVKQQMPPQGMPQGQMPPQGMPQQNAEGEKMTNYLMNKVEEIKQRLGQGDVGALSNVTEAMRG